MKRPNKPNGLVYRPQECLEHSGRASGTLLLRLVGVIAAGVSMAFAQRPAAQFEVASVKPSTEQDQIVGLFTYPGGRIVATRYSLKQFVSEAFDIPEYRIHGGPRWIDTDTYNIEAKPGATSALAQWVPETFKTPMNPEMRLMLQSLLAERFHLRLHHQAERGITYTLTVVKAGHKLSTPVSRPTPFVSFTPTGLRGRNATMDQLAFRLAYVLRCPVQNQTGLDGHYDFVLTSTFTGPEALSEPPVIALIGEQLGLALNSRRGSVDFIRIDQAEKPTVN